MNTGAELGQYFCPNTVKNIQWGWTPLTPSGYASALIPKWLWCKRNSVLNLISRVPVSYYHWHVSSVSTALSSNIPTGLLGWLTVAVSQFSSFQLFVFFGGFSSLNLAGTQQSSRIFIGRGKGQPPQQGVPQWRRAWGRVEALQAGGCGGRGRDNLLRGRSPSPPKSPSLYVVLAKANLGYFNRSKNFFDWGGPRGPL